MIALVRPPSDALARCELTHLDRVPIDPDRARAQHRAYVRALNEALGGHRAPVPGTLPPPKVVRLPERPDLPDAVFVEDVAVPVGRGLVLTRPGAASRRPEVEDVPAAAALAGVPVLGRIEEPGTLDGGDVLILRRCAGDGPARTVLFVGISSRTNRDGAEQLGRLVREAAAEAGEAEPELVRVPVQDCLHLETAVSALGDDAVLLNPRWVDRALFAPWEVVEVPEDEPFAANVLVAGEAVLVSERWAGTRRALDARGLRTVPLDLSELEKAEAGPTCLSVLIPGAG